MVTWCLALSVAKVHFLATWVVCPWQSIFLLLLFPVFQSWLWSVLLGTGILNYPHWPLPLRQCFWQAWPSCPFSSLTQHFHWAPVIIHRTYFHVRIKLCDCSVAFWFSLKNTHKHSLIRTIPLPWSSSVLQTDVVKGRTLWPQPLCLTLWESPLVACVTLNEFLTLTGSQFPYLLRKQLSPL